MRNGKPVSEMSGPELNRVLDRIDKKDSALNKKFIDAGRGYERAYEIMGKSDPLVEQYKALYHERLVVRNEMERRYGPGLPSRLPKGFGRMALQHAHGEIGEWKPQQSEEKHQSDKPREWIGDEGDEAP